VDLSCWCSKAPRELRTRPQSLALNVEATELALGRIYGNTTMDIAAAAESKTGRRA